MTKRGDILVSGTSTRTRDKLLTVGCIAICLMSNQNFRLPKGFNQEVTATVIRKPVNRQIQVPRFYSSTNTRMNVDGHFLNSRKLYLGQRYS